MKPLACGGSFREPVGQRLSWQQSRFKFCGRRQLGCPLPARSAHSLKVDWVRLRMASSFRVVDLSHQMHMLICAPHRAYRHRHVGTVLHPPSEGKAPAYGLAQPRLRGHASVRGCCPTIPSPAPEPRRLIFDHLPLREEPHQAVLQRYADWELDDHDSFKRRTSIHRGGWQHELLAAVGG